MRFDASPRCVFQRPRRNLSLANPTKSCFAAETLTRCIGKRRHRICERPLKIDHTKTARSASAIFRKRSNHPPVKCLLLVKVESLDLHCVRSLTDSRSVMSMPLPCIVSKISSTPVTSGSSC